MTALQAGCAQRPKAGTPIGIQGNIFSGTPVNITSDDSTATASKTKSHRGGFSQGAIIGLVVGLGVLLLIATITILFICFRKRIESSLDPRFGANNITPPHPGSFSDRSAAQAIKLAKVKHNPTIAPNIVPPAQTRLAGRGPLGFGSISTRVGFGGNEETLTSPEDLWPGRY